MMPKANRRNASGPASGRNASAAWAAVSMWVLPWACSVAAVVTMMKNPMMFDSSMPTVVSSPMRKPSRCPRRLVVDAAVLLVVLARSLRSSASSEACQKNM